MPRSSTDRMTSPSGDDFATQADAVLEKLRGLDGLEATTLRLEGASMARKFREWRLSAPPLEVREVHINRLMVWCRLVHELHAKRTA